MNVCVLTNCRGWGVAVDCVTLLLITSKIAVNHMSESLTGCRQHGRGVVFTWSQSVRMFLGNDATEAPHMKNVAS